jgi:prevent-host-death family protein
MERIAASKARKDFRNVIRRASSEGKRVKITHYGKTLVGLVSAKDLELLQNCEARSAAERTLKKAGAKRR